MTDESGFCEAITCLAFRALSAVDVGSVLTGKPLARECSRKEPPDGWLGR